MSKVIVKKTKSAYVKDVDLIKFTKQELNCDGCKKRRVLIFRLTNQLEVMDKIIASLREEDEIELTEMGQLRREMEKDMKELRELTGIESEK